MFQVKRNTKLPLSRVRQSGLRFAWNFLEILPESPDRRFSNLEIFSIHFAGEHPGVPSNSSHPSTSTPRLDGERSKSRATFSTLEITRFAFPLTLKFAIGQHRDDVRKCFPPRLADLAGLSFSGISSSFSPPSPTPRPAGGSEPPSTVFLCSSIFAPITLQRRWNYQGSLIILDNRQGSPLPSALADRGRGRGEGEENPFFCARLVKFEFKGWNGWVAALEGRGNWSLLGNSFGLFDFIWFRRRMGKRMDVECVLLIFSPLMRKIDFFSFLFSSFSVEY